MTTPYTRIKEREAFVDSLISSNLLDLAIDWIGDNIDPAEVFDKKVLDQWAWDNGFKKFE